MSKCFCCCCFSASAVAVVVVVIVEVSMNHHHCRIEETAPAKKPQHLFSGESFGDLNLAPFMVIISTVLGGGTVSLCVGQQLD